MLIFLQKSGNFRVIMQIFLILLTFYELICGFKAYYSHFNKTDKFVILHKNPQFLPNFAEIHVFLHFCHITSFLFITLQYFYTLH